MQGIHNAAGATATPAAGQMFPAVAHWAEVVQICADPPLQAARQVATPPPMPVQQIVFPLQLVAPGVGEP
jgi:hypothetical protein